MLLKTTYSKTRERYYLRKFCLIIISLALISFQSYAQNMECPTIDIQLDDSLTWIQICTGVNYASADSALGEDVFVGIGGWAVTQELTQSWVTSLYFAKLRNMGVRHLYSVRGPMDEGYQGREIGTLDLAYHILSQIQLHPNINKIIVAGHSSGVYVANALFQDLYDGASIDSSHSTDGKILCFFLDERIGTIPNAVELTNASANRLGHIYGVYAFISSLSLYSYAPNEMIALGSMYGSQSSTVVIDASTSGCIAMLCLHMTMINQKPYQSNWYDPRDYGAINSEHPVQTAYLDAITGFDNAHQQSMLAGLWQNYPNPFNPSTSISYSIPQQSLVEIKVYDILGRTIATLVNEEKQAGNYQVEFHADGITSGIYFYTLKAENFIETKKMILMK